jgi:predicted DNA-binding transcriptional regulator YafY
LAETFAVSERTSYRDIQALNESGVPVIGMPGVGYELVEGFKLAPLSFSISETQALVIGVAMLQSHITGRLHQESEIARAKLSDVLLKSVRMGAARSTTASVSSGFSCFQATPNG